MKKKTRYISRLIKQSVNHIDPNAEVILYGSRARGDERPDSDWDILVLTNYNPDVLAERKFRTVLYELELTTGESFSLFVYSKSDWTNVQNKTPFFMNVSQEGINI
ncbi:nucleotidyltransferase domain-containing protein [Saccharicrinis sp. FJH54]|uniref:nucleotidyltransferase domain-containing protein n=1 Tax=Saccharicrinis sp. FJH54 TaxID=3344665 RepID=UPI0035D46C0A